MYDDQHADSLQRMNELFIRAILANRSADDAAEFIAKAITARDLKIAQLEETLNKARAAT